MRDLRAKGTSGDDLIVEGAAIDELARGVRGEVILDGDPGYEDARKVWNEMIDRRPAIIVRCAEPGDAVACVRFAGKLRLRVSIRGGGHNVAGDAVNDGGLVIDLSVMRRVDVDPEQRIVRVQGGATLGDVDNATQPLGLATPLGLVPRTGVAGLSLHGGLGWLLRHYGTSADNIVAADIVTADGVLRRASADENPDLLWALRGGGGNFGVVTSFEFRLHEVGPTVWTGMITYSLDDMARVLKGFDVHMANAPDELTANVLLWTTPSRPMIPDELVGIPSLTIVACYSGRLEDGEDALAPLKRFATPLTDLSGPMEFLRLQNISSASGAIIEGPSRHYWKSVYVNELSEDLSSTLQSAVQDRPSDESAITIYTLGGAFARVAPDEAAMDNRDQRFLVAIEADWSELERDAANVEWARRVFAAVKELSQGQVYLNFPGFAEEKNMVESSFGENIERMREVKAKYDPTNLFRGHLSIGTQTKGVPTPMARAR